MSNSITSFTSKDGTNWHYYSGSFWATTRYKGQVVLMACPAMSNGTPDINITDGEVNACDVEECEQHHLDFVNETFGTNFKLRSVHESGVGVPTYG